MISHKACIYDKQFRILPVHNNPRETVTALSTGKELKIKIHCLDFKIEINPKKPVDLLIMYESNPVDDSFTYSEGTYNLLIIKY